MPRTRMRARESSHDGGGSNGAGGAGGAGDGDVGGGVDGGAYTMVSVFSTSMKGSWTARGEFAGARYET